MTSNRRFNGPARRLTEGFTGGSGVSRRVLWCLTASLLSVTALQSAVAADSAPKLVTLGSDSAAIEAALALCKEYTEGCEREWYEDEAVRTATVSPYRLDSVEVSVEDFATYVKKTGVETAAEVRRESAVTDENDPMSGYYADDKFWHNAYDADARDYPVVHVTFKDAANYCASLGKRLPTEAEWEYAARGAELRNFPWGDNWSDATAYRGAALAQISPRPVGSYQPTAAGYYDLSGSVSEWTVTEEDDAVVVKGGSRFSRNVANLRAAVRRLEDPLYSGDDIGFRCAESLPAWPEAPGSVQLVETQPQPEATSELPVPAEPTEQEKQQMLATRAERNAELRIKSLLSSADTLYQRGKYDIALAELDRADAIDGGPAATARLRSDIESAKALAAKVQAKANQTQIATNTVTTESDSSRIDEILQRVKVMRKVREKKQAEFSGYFQDQLSEAVAYLFTTQDED